MGPRAGLDTEATGKILPPLPEIEPGSPGRPARSQTLYCLSYPAHLETLSKGECSRSYGLWERLNAQTSTSIISMDGYEDRGTRTLSSSTLVVVVVVAL
jgi:hypothetical protein